MNQNNLDYLKNQTKFMGFGEALETQLKEKVNDLKPEFDLQHQIKFGKDDVSSTLHFTKSKESDMYFFNSYDVAVQQPGKELIKQTYPVRQENNLTLKEHYNMLDGRSVLKTFKKLENTEPEGEKPKYKATDETYQAWSDLNFKETDKQGNFLARKMFGLDLERELKNYPIKDLEDSYNRNRLIASLEKGNLQSATVTVDGKDQKVSIAANPKENSVLMYDSNMQRMDLSQIKVQKQEKNEGLAQGKDSTVQQEDQKKAEKQGISGEEKSQKNSQRKKQGMKVS